MGLDVILVLSHKRNPCHCLHGIHAVACVLLPQATTMLAAPLVLRGTTQRAVGVKVLGSVGGGDSAASLGTCTMDDAISVE